MSLHSTTAAAAADSFTRLPSNVSSQLRLTDSDIFQFELPCFNSYTALIAGGTVVAWRSDVVVSHINKVALRRAPLLLTWLTVHTVFVNSQSHRQTQPVTISAGRVGNSIPAMKESSTVTLIYTTFFTISGGRKKQSNNSAITHRYSPDVSTCSSSLFCSAFQDLLQVF